MDELMISGRRFLSSSRAAKEHGYHSDYIGQLIRGGKVRGQKVGRSWYVDEESLAIYLGKTVSDAQAEVAAVKQVVNQVAPQKAETPLAAAAKASATMQAVEQRVAEPIVVDAAKEENSIDAKVSSEEKPRPVLVRNNTPQAHHAVLMHKKEIAVIEPAAAIQPKKTSSLTYVVDDSPLLPDIRKEKTIPAATPSRGEELLSAKQATSVKKTTAIAAPQYGYLAQVAVLVIVGALSFGAVAAASSTLIYKVSAGSDAAQVAGVQMALPY